MQRHRDIAASPVRSASGTWATVVQLITDTLARSPHLPVHQVSAALAVAAPAGMMLTAGGHLEREPLRLLAGDLDLVITTASGDPAFAVEENLNPVPGAADARDWTLYLPTPAPHAETILALVRGVKHLAAGPGPSESAAAATAPTGRANPILYLQALADRQAAR